MRTPPPLRVEIGQSRIAAVLVVLLAVTAVGCSLLMQVDWIYQLALLIGFLACAAWQRRALGLYPWRDRVRVQALAWSDEQGWRVLLKGRDEWQRATLLPGGVVHPWCCGLQFRTEAGDRHDVLLFPDSSDAESLRRLRVLWRYGPDAARARPMTF